MIQSRGMLNQRSALASASLVLAAGIGCVIAALTLFEPPAPAAEPRPQGRFELVGSSPLLHRGMNAALALHGDHAYVGYRSDGSHPDAGILVVDVASPRHPKVVHQIGPPEAANPGETTRELRVWPEQDLLVVLSFGCHEVAHLCLGQPGQEVQPTVRFFDIHGRHEARPKLVSTYEVPDNPHEFFLWIDPGDRDRALLYITTAYAGSGAELDTDGEHLLVTDISGARRGRFRDLERWTPERESRWDEAGLHSLSISRNGRRAYVADLEGGFFMADTSQLARGTRRPRIRQLTPPENAVHHEVPGAHSALPLPGRPYALTTDEVYGAGAGLGPVIGFNQLQGCPWGWSKLIKVTNPTKPRIVGEYKASPWNQVESCGEVPLALQQAASFSSHNPTVTANLGLITWHTAGLYGVDLARPARPRTTAEFNPKPLGRVATEDPALSAGGEAKVVMWSYPIVKDGLIYVVDIRNGLYVLRYRGPHASELRCRTLIEGNSNAGRPVRRCR